MMPQALRQVAEVKRVDPDAMPADQPRLEAEEIPLGPGRVEHVPRRHPDLGHDLGDFVHEGDVDVALGILDHLGRFGRADRRGAEHPGGRDRAIDLRHRLSDRVILPGDDLDDLVDTMDLVARVDPLGAVAELEVAPAHEPRRREQPAANILSHARIDRAFEHDNWSPGRVDQPRHRASCRLDRAQIRSIIPIDRGRNGNDEHVGPAPRLGIGS